MDVQHQHACPVVNQIKVNHPASFFNCTMVGRAADSRTGPSITFYKCMDPTLLFCDRGHRCLTVVFFFFFFFFLVCLFVCLFCFFFCLFFFLFSVYLFVCFCFVVVNVGLLLIFFFFFFFIVNVVAFCSDYSL